MTAIEPFGSERGWIIAPPVHVEPHKIAISWDSGKARAAVHRWSRDSSPGWDHDVYYCSRRTIARIGPR